MPDKRVGQAPVFANEDVSGLTDTQSLDLVPTLLIDLTPDTDFDFRRVFLNLLLQEKPMTVCCSSPCVSAFREGLENKPRANLKLLEMI